MNGDQQNPAPATPEPDARERERRIQEQSAEDMRRQVNDTSERVLNETYDPKNDEAT